MTIDRTILQADLFAQRTAVFAELQRTVLAELAASQPPNLSADFGIADPDDTPVTKAWKASRRAVSCVRGVASTKDYRLEWVSAFGRSEDRALVQHAISLGYVRVKDGQAIVRLSSIADSEMYVLGMGVISSVGWQADFARLGGNDREEVRRLARRSTEQKGAKDFLDDAWAAAEALGLMPRSAAQGQDFTFADSAINDVARLIVRLFLADSSFNLT